MPSLRGPTRLRTETSLQQLRCRWADHAIYLAPTATLLAILIYSTKPNPSVVAFFAPPWGYGLTLLSCASKALSICREALHRLSLRDTPSAWHGVALRPRTTHLVGQPPPNPIRRRRLARTPRPPGTPGGEGEIRSSLKLLDSRITCTAGEAIINSTGRSTASSSSKSSCTALKAYLLKKWGRSVPMHSCMVSADRPVRSPSLRPIAGLPLSACGAP